MQYIIDYELFARRNRATVFIFELTNRNEGVYLFTSWIEYYENFVMMDGVV